jgi:O-methyltransferase domain
MLMTSGDQTRAGDGGRSRTAGTDAGTGQAVMVAWQALGPLMDLVTPMALRVAATLRLADFMPDDGTGEEAVVGDLAGRAGADPDALARVLHHLVQHGVFTEPRPGQFAVNQTTALLRSGHPAAVWLDLDGFGGRMDLAFTGLAHTVRTARAREYLAGLGLDGRCEVVGQSFFDPLPVGADAYLLNRVIHDWDDAAASAILRRCAEAAGSTGRVLVIESHGTTGGDPAAFAEMNLRMLVLTGGRERTINDYSALAADAGLQVTAVHDTKERHVIIECVAV